MARTTPYTRPTLTKLAEVGVRDGSTSRLSFARDGASATRRIRVNWNEWPNAIVKFLGANQIIYDDAVVSPTRQCRINRLVPLQHPDISTLYADEMNLVSGFNSVYGGATNAADGSKHQAYKYAELEVVYRALPYAVTVDNPPADDQLSEDESLRFTSVGDARASTDYLMLPNGTLKYIKNGGGGPTGIPIGFNVGKILPVLEIPVVWHNVPYDIWNPIGNVQTDWFARVFGAGIVTINGTTTSGSPTVTGLTTRNLEPGIPVSASAGIAVGTVIASVDSSTQITLSVNATASGARDLLFNKSGLLGRVNASQMFGYPPGTLLFSDFRPIRRVNAYGIFEWDFEFTFAYDRNKWNFKYYYPAGGVTTDRGWYFVGASSTYYAPGATPDDYTLYDERGLEDIFYLNIVPT